MPLINQSNYKKEMEKEWIKGYMVGSLMTIVTIIILLWITK